MAASDLSKLAAALLDSDTQKAIAAENPYYRFGGIADQIPGLVMQYAAKSQKKPSLGEMIGYSLGSGLLSGGLSSLGGDYQKTLSDRYKSALLSGMSGEAVQPEGLSDSLFSRAKAGSDIFKLQKQILAEERASENAAKQADREAAFQLEIDPRRAAFLGASEAAKKRGELEAYGGEGSGANLLNPITKERMSLESEARSALKTAPQVTAFSDLKTNFDSMLEYSKQNSKAADLAFISGFARVLDPGSTVKEGEIKNAENTQSFLDKLGYSVTSLVDGSQTLSPAVKQQMIQSAGAKYNKFGEGFQGYLDAQKDLVARVGGSPENVFAPTQYVPFNFDDFTGKKGAPKIATKQEDLSKAALENATTPPAPSPLQTLSSIRAKIKAGEPLTSADQASFESLRRQYKGE